MSSQTVSSVFFTLFHPNSLSKFSSFVIPGHLAKMSLFDGKIYFWVNICPYWASRVLYNIQGKYGTNQNCFRTHLAQNSNFIRPGLTFCHPGTLWWPNRFFAKNFFLRKLF